MPSNSIPRTTDVLVIGCGLIGLSCAAAAAERGLDVRVVGEPRVGAASLAAAGLLAPSIEREDGPIHPDELRTLVAAFASWGPVLLYPFAVLGELAYRVLCALALAAAGLAPGRLLGAGLDFGRLFVVSLVVLAPLVLVESLLAVLHRPLSGWIAALAAIALLAFALRAVAAGRTEAHSGMPPSFGP